MMDGYKNEAVLHTMDNFLTHEDIAKLIGSTRQTVTTFINELEKEGLLKLTRKKIILPDAKKIKALVMA